MFPNFDQLVNQALAEKGMSEPTAGPGPGYPPGITGPAAPAGPPQAVPALGIQQRAGAGLVAGTLARKIAEPVMARVSAGAPIVVGGLMAGAIALGAIWLSRQIEHGSPKKGEPKHLRLDMATIGPVVAAIVIGVLVIWAIRKFRELNDAVRMAEAMNAGAPQSQQGPLFQASVPGMQAQSPEAELASAQALLNGAL